MDSLTSPSAHLVQVQLLLQEFTKQINPIPIKRSAIVFNYIRKDILFLTKLLIF